MKAVGYARVSTTQQADEGVSLEAQQARISAYCVAQGLELVHVFTDAGLSGKRADNRPALQQALDAVCETGGILVIYSLSRLSRSVADTLQIAEQLRDAGAELASLSERIDTSSAGGRMIFTMLSAFSAFERELTAERTSAALQFKKLQGERTGTVPYGFSLAADGVQLVPVPEQQQAIQLIQQLREAGCSYRAIAQKLEAAGVKTSKGKAAWSAKVIRDLAARPA